MLCRRCRNYEAEQDRWICAICDEEINSSNPYIRTKVRGEWRGGGFKKVGEIKENGQMTSNTFKCIKCGCISNKPSKKSANLCQNCISDLYWRQVEKATPRIDTKKSGFKKI